jgi:hypothetical protein
MMTASVTYLDTMERRTCGASTKLLELLIRVQSTLHGKGISWDSCEVLFFDFPFRIPGDLPKVPIQILEVS